MIIVFNCNVAQGYNGIKHVNPNDIVAYKDLGNHMMSSYLTLKFYIFKSYNEISNIKIVYYRAHTLKLILYGAKIYFKDLSLFNNKLLTSLNSNFTHFLLIQLCSFWISYVVACSFSWCIKLTKSSYPWPNTKLSKIQQCKTHDKQECHMKLCFVNKFLENVFQDTKWILNNIFALLMSPIVIFFQNKLFNFVSIWDHQPIEQRISRRTPFCEPFWMLKNDLYCACMYKQNFHRTWLSLTNPRSPT
jgi:hypothetical protein